MGCSSLMGFKLRLMLSSLISMISPFLILLSRELIPVSISIFLILMVANDDDQIRLATTLLFIVSFAYVLLRWFK